MTIQENIKLAEYTTFKIGGPARFFCVCKTEADIIEAINFAKTKNVTTFVLGGGSNIVVADKGYAGLVVKMELEGITFGAGLEDTGARPNGQTVKVTASAGEMWDHFVEETVKRGLYGLENLSAIPGTVGAAPVQNIGAYGVEVGDCILSVRALDTRSMTFVDLSGEKCAFGYRDSLFKREKGRYVITQVTFGLQTSGQPAISYKDLAEYFKKKLVASPSLREVRDAVIDIRWKKLPDWKMWGTAGSFFKNPVIKASTYAELVAKYPGLPGFNEPDGQVKVSLSWILDKVCHAKELKMGNVKVYENQALVIVASAGATAEDVMKLAQELMREVEEKTGIKIEGEVEWVN